MKKIIDEYLKKFQKLHGVKKKTFRAFLLLALVVMAGVSWGLHLTGISMTADDEGADAIVDYGQYITNAKIEKLVGNEWVTATEFVDGDQVRVSIDYKIPDGVVVEGSETMIYQLADGIRPNQSLSGRVSGTLGGVHYDDLGEYTIEMDGTITITFNQTFLEHEGDFTGNIYFEGTASLSKDSEKTEFKFKADGTTYTITPKPEDSDLSVKKTASEPDGSKITYTIEVSSKNGTAGESVKVLDNLSYTGLPDDQVRIGTITVRDKAGNPVEGWQQNVTEQTGTKDLEITDLPALGKDAAYTITYEVEYGNTLTGDGTAYLNNTATGYKGTEWKAEDSTHTTVSEKMIEKSGSATDNNTMVTWTIRVNPNGQLVEGYTLSDVMKLNGKEYALPEGTEITVKNDTTGETTTVTSFADIQLTGTNSYTITYKTPVPMGEAGHKDLFQNTATIEKDGKTFTDSDSVSITQPERLKKVSKGTETADGEHALVNWQATIDTLRMADGEITYTDTLTDAKGTVNPAIHCTTREQLTKTLSVTKDKSQKVDYILTCYDADGNEVTNDTDPVVKFTIRFQRPNSGNKYVYLFYSTTISTADLAEGESIKVKNGATIGTGTVRAEDTYTKPKRLFKYGGTKDSSGNISYDTSTSGSTSVKYDEAKGKLYYRIVVKPTDTNGFTITDTLPSGTTLNADDVSYKLWISDREVRDDVAGWNIQQNRPQITIDGQNVTIQFAGGFPQEIVSKNEGFCVDYALTISDSYWDDLKNSNKTYSNTVTWGNRTESQDTHVRRETKVIDKNGEQILNKNGDPTSRIRYYVTINPTGETLNDGNPLTLTDTLSMTGSMDAELKLDTVKLYTYDSKQEANHFKGQELDASTFTFRYDEEKHAFTAVVPDKTPCVLEYEYEADLSGVQVGTLSNSAELEGRGTHETSKELEVRAATSGASVVKQNQLEIVKVDSERYQVTLAGAQFALQKYSGPGDQWEAEAAKTYTTDENGIADIPKEDVTENALYRLYEKKAPTDYSKSDKMYYIVWLNDQTEQAWWNANQAAMQGIGLQKSDIKFLKISGTLIVPNRYSKVEVVKNWTDSEGKAIEPPTGTNISVQLYRQSRQLKAYTVTVTTYNCDQSKSETRSIRVAPNSSLTFTYSGIYEDAKYEFHYIYDGKEKISPAPIENGKASMMLPEVTEDKTVTVILKNKDPNVCQYVPTFSNYTEPSEYLPASNAEAVSGTVTLNASNNWRASWSGLPEKDENGNPYYYTVRELDTMQDYEVSYINNEGIQTGQISIINKQNQSTYVLPNTGGSGILPYLIGGLSLWTVGLFYHYRKRSKRREGADESS